MSRDLLVSGVVGKTRLGCAGVLRMGPAAEVGRGRICFGLSSDSCPSLNCFVQGSPSQNLMWEFSFSLLLNPFPHLLHFSVPGIK